MVAFDSSTVTSPERQPQRANDTGAELPNLAANSLSSLVQGANSQLSRTDTLLRQSGAKAPTSEMLDRATDAVANSTSSNGIQNALKVAEANMDRSEQGRSLVEGTRTLAQGLDRLLNADLAGKISLKDKGAQALADGLDRTAKDLKKFAEFGAPTAEKDALLDLATELEVTRRHLSEHRNDTNLDPSMRDRLDQIQARLDVADARIKGVFKQDFMQQVQGAIRLLEAEQARQGFSDALAGRPIDGAAATATDTKILQLYQQLTEFDVTGARACTAVAT